MPLDRALHELTRNLGALSQDVAELCTVAKDRPQPIAIADPYDEAVDAIQMCLVEAHEEVTRLAIPAATSEEKAKVWQALLLCQERIDDVTSLLYNLHSIDQVLPLLCFGVSQGGEWPSWAMLVKDGVGRCLLPLAQVRQAQLLCWQEMAEHSAGGGVTVHNTAVGQQIFWPDSHPPLNSRDR